MPLTAVADLLEARTGRRPTRATLSRWCVVGLKTRNGVVVKLAASRCGRMWVTSEAAVDAFLAALNA